MVESYKLDLKSVKFPVFSLINRERARSLVRSRLRPQPPSLLQRWYSPPSRTMSDISMTCPRLRPVSVGDRCLRPAFPPIPSGFAPGASFGLTLAASMHALLGAKWPGTVAAIRYVCRSVDPVEASTQVRRPSSAPTSREAAEIV